MHGQPNSGAGGAAAPEHMTAHSGASYPRSRKDAWAWVAAAEEGKAPSPCKALSTGRAHPDGPHDDSVIRTATCFAGKKYKSSRPHDARDPSQSSRCCRRSPRRGSYIIRGVFNNSRKGLVRPGSGAETQEEPRALRLQVIDGGSALEEPVLVIALTPKVARDERVMPQRGAEHGEALGVERESPVTDPYAFLISAKVGDVWGLLFSGVLNPSVALMQADACPVPECGRENVVKRAGHDPAQRRYMYRRGTRTQLPRPVAGCGGRRAPRVAPVRI